MGGLAVRINETHVRAIEHAGKALQHAFACGELLLEAKLTIPHGQWLPWLRANVAFGERTAQGYMRIAARLPKSATVADLPLRQVLGGLRTPLRAAREVIDAELDAWTADSRADRAKRPADPKDWSIEDAQACAAHIRRFDAIMHRYGVCPDVGDPEPCCTVCGDELEAAE
ncbi:MAG: DUF3102 domain-containing protein [Xanthobacteraceae bacterium]